MKIYISLITVILILMLLVPNVCLGEKRGAVEKQKANRVSEQDTSRNPVPAKLDSEDASGEASSEASLLLVPSKSTAGEAIKWHVLSGGGTHSSVAGFQLRGTLGQTAAGLTAAGAYEIHQGYWQNFADIDCCDFPGDANNDGFADIGDCVYIINFIWKDGPYPVCMNEADTNHDCEPNVGDVVWLINYIFKDGPPPTCGCID